eukprot:evm.model.scf_3755.1 EVM.evm.TU.scf_3755.1   scf_3755:1221-5578(+)
MMSFCKLGFVCLAASVESPPLDAEQSSLLLDAQGSHEDSCADPSRSPGGLSQDEQRQRLGQGQGTRPKASSPHIETSTSEADLQRFGAEPLHGVHGINMFLARWAFDLARSSTFKSVVMARIQKKLSELRRPNYVNSLSLVDLELGTNFPVFRNVRALPSPSSVIWPQLLVDVYYEGGLELTIETTVDPRDMAAWNTLDKAITTIGGQGGRQEAQPFGSAGPGKAPSDQCLGSKLPQGSDEALQDVGLQDSSRCDGDSQNGANNSGIGEGAGGNGQERPRRRPGGFQAFRKIAAAKAKQFASRMAESISKVPIRTCIHVAKLDGTMVLWVAPPPSNALWVSFVGQPKLELRAKPGMMNRVIKNAVIVGRISSWLEHRLLISFRKTFVFPNCHDLKFPGFLDPTKEDGLQMPAKVVRDELQAMLAADKAAVSLSTPPVSGQTTPEECSPAAQPTAKVAGLRSRNIGENGESGGDLQALADGRRPSEGQQMGGSGAAVQDPQSGENGMKLPEKEEKESGGEAIASILVQPVEGSKAPKQGAAKQPSGNASTVGNASGSPQEDGKGRSRDVWGATGARSSGDGPPEDDLNSEDDAALEGDAVCSSGEDLPEAKVDPDRGAQLVEKANLSSDTQEGYDPWLEEFQDADVRVPESQSWSEATCRGQTAPSVLIQDIDNPSSRFKRAYSTDTFSQESAAGPSHQLSPGRQPAAREGLSTGSRVMSRSGSMSDIPNLPPMGPGGDDSSGQPTSARSRVLSHLPAKLGAITSEEASAMAGAFMRAAKAKAGHHTQRMRVAIGNRTAQLRSRGGLFGRQTEGRSKRDTS